MCTHENCTQRTWGHMYAHIHADHEHLIIQQLALYPASLFTFGI